MASLKIRRRVVVTDMGCVSSFGYGVEQTWSALMKADSAVRQITRFNASQHRTRIAAEVNDECSLHCNFDLASSSALSGTHLSRNAQFSLAAAAELAVSQQWDKAISCSDVEIFLGSGFGRNVLLRRSVDSTMGALRQPPDDAVRRPQYDCHPSGQPVIRKHTSWKTEGYFLADFYRS